MGAGFYGVPLEVCSRAMIEPIREHLKGATEIQEVWICVIDQREYAPFAAQLASLKPHEG